MHNPGHPSDLLEEVPVLSSLLVTQLWRAQSVLAHLCRIALNGRFCPGSAC